MTSEILINVKAIESFDEKQIVHGWSCNFEKRGGEGNCWKWGGGSVCLFILFPKWRGNLKNPLSVSDEIIYLRIINRIKVKPEFIQVNEKFTEKLRNCDFEIEMRSWEEWLLSFWNDFRKLVAVKVRETRVESKKNDLEWMRDWKEKEIWESSNEMKEKIRAKEKVS